MKINEEIIRDLNYKCKQYDGINKYLVQTKNRLSALNEDAKAKHQDDIMALETIKNRTKRQIEKYCDYWPIWSDWMKSIPGVGGFIGGNLILLYYYRFTTTCPKCNTVVEKKEHTFYCPVCEKSVKGDGVSYKVEEKDFPCVSAWWSYMGRSIVDGKMQKRKKGVVSNWSAKGRMVGFQFADQMNRQKLNHPYKLFLEKRKAKRKITHPKATPMHHLNMAKHETCKLFLSHFWHVARTLAGKSTAGPYAEVILGHTNIIPPYFWSAFSETIWQLNPPQLFETEVL